MRMFLAISRLVAEAGTAPGLEAQFRARQRLVDAHAGFRRLQLARGRGTNEYLLLLEWDDIDSFRAYVKSADFDHAHPDLGEGVEPGGLRAYDVIVDSRRGG